MFDNAISLVGNLTIDPDFKVTTGGVAVVRFRLACSRRIFDRTANEWRDGEPAYFSVTAWRQLAQNIHTSLRKGDRAVVVGRMRQSTYENSNKERRTSWEVEADAVGAELSWSCAHVQRTRRPVTDNADSADPANTADTFTSPDGQRIAAETGEILENDRSYLDHEGFADQHDAAQMPEPVTV